MGEVHELRPSLPRDTRYVVVITASGNALPKLFGPFFSKQQADREAEQWNRARLERGASRVDYVAITRPMGSLKALHEFDA